jgi:peptide/nickel transport system permease protein
MATYLLRRILWGLVVLWVLITGVFFVTRIIPADPARAAAGLQATEAQVERIRSELGLDQPLFTQYLDYFSRLVRADFGKSITTQTTIGPELARNTVASVELVVVSFLAYVFIAVPLGIIVSVNRRGIVGKIVRIVAIAGGAAPAFWIAIVLQIVAYSMLGILPAGGRIGFEFSIPTITNSVLIDSLLAGNLAAFNSALVHMVLPVTAVIIGPIALGMRMTRAAIIGELLSDYARTARAKGLKEASVLIRHVLKNAMIPVVTVFGWQFAYMFLGVFLVEVVFIRAGLGRYAVVAINTLDFNIISAIAMISGVVFVTVNIVVDLLYGALDPRIVYD